MITGADPSSAISPSEMTRFAGIPAMPAVRSGWTVSSRIRFSEQPDTPMARVQDARRERVPLAFEKHLIQSEAMPHREISFCERHAK